MHSASTVLTILALGGSLVGTGVAAPLRADATERVQVQLRAASEHAALAASARDPATARAHLQHTLNCLTGTRSAAARARGPCRGQGRGVIADYRSGKAEPDPGTIALLEQARELAAVGTGQYRHKELAAAALGVRALLDQAQQALPPPLPARAEAEP